MALLDDYNAENRAACDAIYSITYACIYPRLPARFRKDAEDIAQECLISIFEKKPSFYLDGDLKSYACQVAINKTRDFYRKEAALKRGAGQVVNVDDPESRVHNWESSCPTEEALCNVSYQELRTVLKELRKQVPEAYDAILTDFFFLELQHKEIAEKRGIAVGSVGGHINQGLLRLQAAIKKQPKLRDELAAYLIDPKNIKVLLPLASISRNFFSEDELQGDGGIFSRDESWAQAKHQTEGLSTTSPGAVPAKPNLPEIIFSTAVPTIRILPTDKPAVKSLTQEAFSALKTTVQAKHKKASGNATSQKTGCLVLIMGILAVFSGMLLLLLY